MNANRQSWTVTEAKARFGEVINLALGDGPQVITRNGRRAVVVVSADEWAPRAKRKGNLAEFLSRSPLCGSPLKLARFRDRPRRIKL